MTPLDPAKIGRALEYYPSLESTMTIAALREPGTVVIADEQTAGQGRHGRSWHSEAHAGIYCSIVLSPSPVLTLALGLAAQAAIVETSGLVCDIRWPNDLMLSDRKVAGVLVQLVDRKAVAGIGINVNQTAFPPELASQATSLRQCAGRVIEREPLITELLSRVEAFATEDTQTILRLFAHHSSYVAGRRVTVDQPGGMIEGTTAGLDPSGFLIVRKDDGTDTLVVAGGVRAVGS